MVRRPRKTQKPGDTQIQRQRQRQADMGGQRQRWTRQDKVGAGELGAAGPRGDGASGRHVCGEAQVQKGGKRWLDDQSH